MNGRDAPELIAYAGGTTETDPDDPEVEPEDAGGVTIHRTFDRVANLNVAFGALVDDHDLEEIDAGEDAE